MMMVEVEHAPSEIYFVKLGLQLTNRSGHTRACIINISARTTSQNMKPQYYKLNIYNAVHNRVGKPASVDNTVLCLSCKKKISEPEDIPENHYFFLRSFGAKIGKNIILFAKSADRRWLTCRTILSTTLYTM